MDNENRLIWWQTIASCLFVFLVISIGYILVHEPKKEIVTKEIPVEVPCEPKIEFKEKEVFIKTPCPTCVCDKPEPTVKHTKLVCEEVRPWECNRGNGGWGVRYVEKECNTGEIMVWDCETNTSSLRSP